MPSSHLLCSKKDRKFAQECHTWWQKFGGSLPLAIIMKWAHIQNRADNDGSSFHFRTTSTVTWLPQTASWCRSALCWCRPNWGELVYHLLKRCAFCCVSRIIANWIPSPLWCRTKKINWEKDIFHWKMMNTEFLFSGSPQLFHQRSSPKFFYFSERRWKRTQQSWFVRHTNWFTPVSWTSQMTTKSRKALCPERLTRWCICCRDCGCALCCCGVSPMSVASLFCQNRRRRFLGQARRSRDGLMESRLRRHCHHRRAEPPPPQADPPSGLIPPWPSITLWGDGITWWMVGGTRPWHWRSVLVPNMPVNQKHLSLILAKPGDGVGGCQ